jgi:tRNA A37 threonylcarbamoyladenosine modification protein TsaB
MLKKQILFLCTAFPSASFALWGTTESYRILPFSPHPDDPRGIVIFSVLSELEEEPTFRKHAYRLAVCIGPGAMTGLKYGIAIAQGIALRLHIPLVGVPSFFGWYDFHHPVDRVEIPLPQGGAYIAYIRNSEKGLEILDPSFTSESSAPPSPPNPFSFLMAASLLPDLSPLELKPLYIRPPQIYPQKDLLGRSLASLFPPEGV